VPSQDPTYSTQNTSGVSTDDTPEVLPSQDPVQNPSRDPVQDTAQDTVQDTVLKDLFPREPIAALPFWCTGAKGSGCTRCVAACPWNAISLGNDGPIIDEALCTSCGICCGICDSFQWSRITLEDLVARAEREANDTGFVCFTCNDHLSAQDAPTSNVVVLPCLAAGPPEFWSALLAKDITVKLYLDQTLCETCSATNATGSMLYNYALKQAELWTGKKIHLAHALPQRESLLDKYSHIDDADRRSLFSGFANESLDIASGKYRRRNAGTVDAFHENQERMRAQGRIRSAQALHDLPEVIAQKPEWPRQKLIVQAACALPDRADLLERYTTTTNMDLCNKSHTCVTKCPTAARHINEQGYPEVDDSKCIACGLCVAHCPNQACDFFAITGSAYCERKLHA